MNLEDPETLMILTAIFFAAIAYFKVHKDDEGRIDDKSVTLHRVMEALEEFKPKKDLKLKTEFTENSIQVQLYEFLLSRFVHVVREQGIEGLNATKIDFDIGRGKVGIEVKLARVIYKEAGFDRLVGQVEKYTKNKYNSINLIIAVFGTKAESQERAYLKRLEEMAEEKGVSYIFKEINK